MRESLEDLLALPALDEQEELFSYAAPQTTVASSVDTPVARVHVEAPHFHLDHTFDYLVPERLDAQARPGMRVKVRLGHSQYFGYIIERVAASAHSASLTPLLAVQGKVPALSAGIYPFMREVTLRGLCLFKDCLSLGNVHRHARAEKAFLERFGSWEGALEEGREIAARWRAQEECAGEQASSWRAYLTHGLYENDLLIRCVNEYLGAGRQVIVVLPTMRQAQRAFATLEEHFPGISCLYSSGLAHEERYTAFLQMTSGVARIAVGTRSAVWAPGPDIGAIIVIDEASPHLREQRSPYLSARDLARIRCEVATGGWVGESNDLLASTGPADLITMAPYLSEEVAQLIRHHGMVLVDRRKAEGPRLSLPEQWARHVPSLGGRIPSGAFELVRHGLTTGPVLIVVPFHGYASVLACDHCATLATCPECSGMLAIPGRGMAPQCVRCGHRVHSWACTQCHRNVLVARRIGSARTAQEIGHAFPGVSVFLASPRGEESPVRIDATPRIVVATAGSEIEVEGGYSAALVLDSRFLQGFALGNETQFVRRAALICGLVRPASQGGHIMFVGGADHDLAAILARGDLECYAFTALDEREVAGLPPSSVWFSFTGRREAIRQFIAYARRELERIPVDGIEGSDVSPGADLFSAGENQVPVEALLAGGVHNFTAATSLAGPVKVSEADERVFLRCADRHWHACGEALRKAYSDFRLLGEGLHREVNPRM